MLVRPVVRSRDGPHGWPGVSSLVTSEIPHHGTLVGVVAAVVLVLVVLVALIVLVLVLVLVLAVLVGHL